MKVAERFIKQRSFWFLALGVWGAIAVASATWNITALQHHAQMMARERGKNFFNIILLSRKWNAEYGPVYVPISESTRPNPHLNIPNRDVITNNGLELTVVNPSYMTRQMSELAGQKETYFHLTSLNPIRPQNKADPWEEEALKSFHKGEKEKVQMVIRNGHKIFRYMAPLTVEASCMACHAQQGYKVGDIRGGLSVNLDAEQIFQSLEQQKNFVIIVHSMGWMITSLLLVTFLNAVRNHTLFLEGVNYAKQKDLQRHKSKLQARERELNDLITRDTTTGLHTAEHFKQLSSIMWNNAISNSTPISILLLEVDYFKDYSDNYGALEGDICLKQVTSAITGHVMEKGSVIARYGGASFVIMLSGPTQDEALDIAEHIHGAVIGLGIPHETSEVSTSVTITGTVSTKQPRHGELLTDFVRKLRRCLSSKSATERNRIHLCPH